MKLLSKIVVAAMLAGAPVAAFAQAGVTFEAVTFTANHAERLTVEQLRAKYQDDQSRYLKVGEVEVHYKDEGKGPVILLAHGSVSTMRTWDETVKVLKDRYRVIRFDLPGFGLSSRISDKAAAEIKRPTDVPLAILKHLGVDKVAVASGVSSGGTMVAMLAAENPGLVDRLVLSNMPVDPVRTDHLRPSQAFLDEQAKAKKLGFQEPSYWREYFNFYFGTPSRATPKILSEYYDFNRRVAEKHPIAFIAQVKDGSYTTPLFGTLNIPVLLAWGSKDPLLPDSAAHRLGDVLKNAHVSKLFMPDVGHYPPVEVGERFGHIIANYAESVTPVVEAAK